MSVSNLVEEPEKRIKKWLEQIKSYRLSSPIEDINKEVEGIESQIEEAAYYISLKEHNYEDLCWILAEKILKRTLLTPTIDQIKEKAAEIFNLSKSYDELCWLNAELDISQQK